jgi:hypothetical protein
MPESELPPETPLPGSGALPLESASRGDAGAAVADAASRLERLSKEFEDIKRSLAQLRRIAKPDPAMALVRARRVLEYVIRDLFQRHVPERAGTRPLDNLVARLVKDEVIDLHTKAYIDQVRELGNAATHGDVGKEFSETDAFRAIDSLMVVLEWYFKKEQIGDIEQLRKEVESDDAAVQSYKHRFQHAQEQRRTIAHWRKFGGVIGMCIAAFALGMVHRWFGVGPPWPPPAQAALFTFLAMTVAWFANDAAVQADIMGRRAPRWLAIGTGTALVLFAVLFTALTVPAPAWPNLEARGLELQPPVARHLAGNPGTTVDDMFAGAGYDPLAIWVPWTVIVVRCALLLLWLALAAGVAALADCFWWSIQEERYDSTLPA